MTAKAKTDPVPAVAYVRMSSGQQEASPEQQRAEIRKLAQRDGYRILREYFDSGVSGDNSRKRVEFRRMIRDAQEVKDFAAILCYDQSRFGRFDSVEAGRWVAPLREAGVWLVTVAEGRTDWNDFAGRMMYGIQQEGKHQFLIDLSRTVLRGKIEAAKTGRGANNPPMGMDRLFYDENGKPVKRVRYAEKFSKPKDWSVKFVLSEDSRLVETVRWIFRTFADTDCGMTWLAADLNRRGIKTPLGKRWSVQTIQGVLENRHYTGASVFGRKRCGKYHQTGPNGDVTKADRKAARTPIVVEAIHEQLIDRSTFERVQAKLADRRQTRTKPRYSRYLLSGVLRCGHCGAPLAGKGYDGRDVPRYYICTTGATRPGACKRYQIQQSAIEDYVLKVVDERLFSPRARQDIEKAIHRRAKARVTFKADAKAIQAQITALDRKIAKGTENLLLADKADVPDLSALLAAWRRERAEVQGQLEKMATNPTGSAGQELARRTVAELDRLREQFRSAEPTRVRAVIKAVVEKVELWWTPYGKRNKRFLRGALHFRDEIALLSSGFRGR